MSVIAFPVVARAVPMLTPEHRFNLTITSTTYAEKRLRGIEKIYVNIDLMNMLAIMDERGASQRDPMETDYWISDTKPTENGRMRYEMNVRHSDTQELSLMQIADINRLLSSCHPQ
jgi:hypothetical protein